MCKYQCHIDCIETCNTQHQCITVTCWLWEPHIQCCTLCTDWCVLSYTLYNSFTQHIRTTSATRIAEWMHNQIPAVCKLVKLPSVECGVNYKALSRAHTSATVSLLMSSRYTNLNPNLPEFNQQRLWSLFPSFHKNLPIMFWVILFTNRRTNSSENGGDSH